MSEKTKKTLLTVLLIAAIIVIVYLFVSGKFGSPSEEPENASLSLVTGEDGTVAPADTSKPDNSYKTFDLSTVPEFSGKEYAIINSNVPFFTESEYTTEPFETYSPLDSQGRCGVAYANICKELMPTSKRGDIYMIRPSGWQHVEYDFIDGYSLYNRSHLIAHSLAGEDANERNLITGTRYMNKDGMNPFENMVGDYVKETGNHVLYRVTPVFEGKNLICSGVLMEAYSVEDRGEGICFCVYCYNVQPGVVIDYSNGKSHLAPSTADGSDEVMTYILHTGTKKFHLPTCEHVAEIREGYRGEYTGTRTDLINMGYVPCGGCNP